jgi:hypothetical protein
MSTTKFKNLRHCNVIDILKVTDASESLIAIYYNETIHIHEDRVIDYSSVVRPAHLGTSIGFVQSTRTYNGVTHRLTLDNFEALCEEIPLGRALILCDTNVLEEVLKAYIELKLEEHRGGADLTIDALDEERTDIKVGKLVVHFSYFTKFIQHGRTGKDMFKIPTNLGYRSDELGTVVEISDDRQGHPHAMVLTLMGGTLLEAPVSDYLCVTEEETRAFLESHCVS